MILILYSRDLGPTEIGPKHMNEVIELDFPAMACRAPKCTLMFSLFFFSDEKKNTLITKNW